MVVCEWILSSLHAGPQMRRTLSITENQQQDPQARLMKQVILFYVMQFFVLSINYCFVVCIVFFFVFISFCSISY